MKNYSFELEQDGMVVASGSGPDEKRVHVEGMHYAAIYSQDGPCKLRFFNDSTEHTADKGAYRG